MVDNSSQDILDDAYIGRTPLNATFVFDDLTIQNDGNLETGSSSDISYTTLDWATKGIITDGGGTFPVISGGGDLTIVENCRVYEKVVRTFNSLTINGGFVMYNYDMNTNKLVVTNDVTVGPNGLLAHYSNTTSQTNVINIEAANFYLTAGGLVDASARGFRHSEGTGAGTDGSQVWENNSWYWKSGGGAGYGGAGGNGVVGAGGSAYGSLTQPINIGSGGADTNGNLGGAGGGAVRINVAGTADVSGIINANGGNATGADYAGGGSGGSIWISCSTLDGYGSMSANGGNASTSNRGGGGGGGRISVDFTTNESTLTSIKVTPGAGVNSGYVGTIYPGLYPTVSTQATTRIADVSARGNGSIDSIGLYGITNHGHIWSASDSDPMLIDPPQSQWQMNDNAGDAVVADSVGGKNGTATQNTSVMTTSGKMNSALAFNNASDYIGVSSPNLPTGDFTYSFWTNLANANDETFLMASNGSGGNEFAIYHDSSAMRVSVDNTNDVVVAPALSQTATWYHIAVTRSGSLVRLYVNGEQVGNTGSNGNTLNFSTCQLLMGTDADSACSGTLGNWLGGSLDDIRIYNQALTYGEIAIIYNSGNGTEGHNTSAVFDSNSLGLKPTVGAFMSNMIGLTPITPYYARAYETTSDGSTKYGSVTTFTTVKPLDHFTITGSPTQEAGTSQTVTITAKDEDGNTFLTYDGDRILTFSGASDAPDGTHPRVKDKNNADVNFGSPATLAFVDGAATTDMSLFKAENAEIETTDGTYTTIGDPSFDLNVSVSAAETSNAETSISLSPSSGTAGTQETITVTAKDQYGNQRTSGGDTVVLSVAGANSATPSVTDNGNGTYTATYTPTHSGQDLITGTINASAIGSDTDGTSDGTYHLTVSAGGVNAAHSVISVLPSPVAAETQVTITVTTRDQYDNSITSGGAMVTLSVAGANSDTPSVTDNGNGTYSATYTPMNTGEDLITGTLNASAIGADTDGTSDGTFHLTVNEAGVPGHFVITGSATQVAGTSQTITITAIDVNGGVDATYDGDYALTFSGANNSPDGTHPTVKDKTNADVNFGSAATITFTNGVATTDMDLYKVENAEVETTDGVYTTTERPSYDLNVSVSAATISNADTSISASPDPASVGRSETITVTAMDIYGNLLTSGGDTVVVSVAGANSETPSVTDNGNGTYTATYIPANLGEDLITGTINASAIGADTDGVSDGTYHLTVVPLPMDHFVITGSASQTAGDSQTITITAKDEDENTFYQLYWRPRHHILRRE